MGFLTKAFDYIARLSAKLPAIDFKTYFIVVVLVIVLGGLIAAVTYLASRSYRLTKACKRILRYLDSVESVDDDNANELSACFDGAPQSLKDCWTKYIGVRFGFPSQIVTEADVYDREVRSVKDLRPTIFVACALIVLGAFAFWGYGTLDSASMGVIHFIGLALIGIIYLVLLVLSRKLARIALQAFDDMQDELDSKVNLQIYKNYATDSSPLSELAAMLDEVIARNTFKEVDIDEDELLPKTPIEALIDKSDKPVAGDEADPNAISIDDLLKDPPAEPYVEEEPAPPRAPAEEPKRPSDPPQRRAGKPYDDRYDKPAPQLDTDDDESDDRAIKEFWQELLKKRAELSQKNGDLTEEGKNAVSRKIATLPALLDSMFAAGMSKAMKINVASILISAYKMFSESPEDRRVIIRCLKKVMDSLKNPETAK